MPLCYCLKIQSFLPLGLLLILLSFRGWSRSGWAAQRENQLVHVNIHVLTWHVCRMLRVMISSGEKATCGLYELLTAVFRSCWLGKVACVALLSSIITAIKRILIHQLRMEWPYYYSCFSWRAKPKEGKINYNQQILNNDECIDAVKIGDNFKCENGCSTSEEKAIK